MDINIFPEKDGDYLNLSAFNEEDGILGLMRVHESATDIEIEDIVIFPEYNYGTVVHELFSFLLKLWEENDCGKLINLTYELNEESKYLHYYLHERNDFILRNDGGIYRTTVKDAASIADQADMKKLSAEVEQKVKPLKELTDLQKAETVQKLIQFSLMDKSASKKMDEEFDADLSCATCNQATGEVNTALMARYDGEEDTLYIDAAFLVNEQKIQFMELVIFFMKEAMKKYPDAKLVLAAVNNKAEALCDHFASRIENVTKSEVYTGIWTEIQDEKLENVSV